jgi:molybdopterin converting factor small subunit
MNIPVLLFASLRTRFGEEICVDLNLPATVGELERSLRKKGVWVEGARIAVNHRFATETDEIQGNEEVAVIPPVSGG